MFINGRKQVLLVPFFYDLILFRFKVMNVASDIAKMLANSQIFARPAAMAVIVDSLRTFEINTCISSDYVWISNVLFQKLAKRR